MKKRRKRTRKSPHKHTVRTKHPRYKVSSYARGKGDKPSPRVRKVRPTVARRKPTPRPTKGDEFTVRVEYIDRSFEHVNVTAENYTGALDTGIETRKFLREPVMIRLRRR